MLIDEFRAEVMRSCSGEGRVENELASGLPTYRTSFP